MAKFLIETFTGTEGTAITSHGTDTGGPWVLRNGVNSAVIRSGYASFEPGSSNFATYTTTTGSAGAEMSVHARLKFDNTAGFVQFLGRYRILSGNGVYYYVSISGLNISYGYRPSGTGGSDVTLGVMAHGFVNGETYDIHLSVRNGAKTVYVNGTPIFTSTNNTVTGAAADKAGLFFHSNGTAAATSQVDSVFAMPAYYPGAITATVNGATAATLSCTAATGDTGTYSVQYQRALDASGSPGTWENIGVAQTGITFGVAPAGMSDSTLESNTIYWYRALITYSVDSISLATAASSITTVALTPGTTSGVGTGLTTTTVSHTAAADGLAPYTYQFQRAPDVSGTPGTWADVGSSQELADGVAPTDLNDSGLVHTTIYWYRVEVTDSNNIPVYSTPVAVATNTRTPTTYYVSAEGDDENDGLSPENAFATIDKLNEMVIAAGDKVYFRGGDTFAGNLLVKTPTQPTSNNRTVISSYGNGKASISPGTNYGIKIEDTDFVTVHNIHVEGPGLTITGTYPNKTCTTSSIRPGVYIVNTATSTYRKGIVVDNVSVTGTAIGIKVVTENTAPTAGFDGVVISNCHVYYTQSEGIIILGNHLFNITARINRYCRVVNCNVHDIIGKTSHNMASGFPIYLFNCIDCTIERCTTHTCGEALNNSSTNGVCGPMFVHCTRCVMRFNESYNMYSPHGIDGNSFDFDADCKDCLIEYCYGHDVDGANMLLWNDDGSTTSSGNVVRYNIFVNGSRRSTSNGAAALATAGTAGVPIVHNNVFYNAKSTNGSSVLIFCSSHASAGYKLFNNIFSISGAMTFGNVRNTTLMGNVYNARQGSTFSITASGSTFTSLSGMRAAGFESGNGELYGAAGDPMFSAAGTRPVIMPDSPVSRLTAYDLNVGSAASGVGVNLERYQIHPPAFDFHQNIAQTGESYMYNGFDAGPISFGSTLATGSNDTVIISGSGGTKAYLF